VGVTGPDLQRVAPGPDRERWVPLLALADELVPLRAYLQEGELYGLVDMAGGPRAAVLVIDEGPGVAELRAVAVAEAEQGRGLGTQVITATLAALAARGFRRVTVGTAGSGVRQLAFYQRCGFRLSHVERDYFTEAKGYPLGLTEQGIAVRDMVWMDLEIVGADGDG
jgi:ribosomal protein S18 acetylase RimI-like enzyme